MVLGVPIFKHFRVHVFFLFLGHSELTTVIVKHILTSFCVSIICYINFSSHRGRGLESSVNRQGTCTAITEPVGSSIAGVRYTSTRFL